MSSTLIGINFFLPVHQTMAFCLDVFFCWWLIVLLVNRVSKGGSNCSLSVVVWCCPILWSVAKNTPGVMEASFGCKDKRTIRKLKRKEKKNEIRHSDCPVVINLFSRENQPETNTAAAYFARPSKGFHKWLQEVVCRESKGLTLDEHVALGCDRHWKVNYQRNLWLMGSGKGRSLAVTDLTKIHHPFPNPVPYAQLGKNKCCTQWRGDWYVLPCCTDTLH